VDWVFPAWMLYVEYATQKIAETFRSQRETTLPLQRRDDAVATGGVDADEREAVRCTKMRVRISGGKETASDEVWMRISALHLKIHGISVSARFPDLLKLPRERLELFQLGWRASDEGEVDGRPVMVTTQPWQVFAWVAARYGELYIYVDSVNLIREGISVSVHLTAKSWKQRWNKAEAIDLVASNLKRGEWAPLFAMWLGDGEINRRKALIGDYRVVIAAKEPWRLGISISAREALVASGRESFVKLREAASTYGVVAGSYNGPQVDCDKAGHRQRL
jgi:hypothetical protein